MDRRLPNIAMFLCRVCPIFQVSNVTGVNLDLLKMFLNLLSSGANYSESEPAEFQVDETYSVPVSITDDDHQSIDDNHR
jgi:GTPase